MQRKPSLYGVFLLIGLLLFQGFAPNLQAQAAPPPPTPQELDQLLAPIALYPDSLLAQITTASTNPQEILDVENWLQQNQNLSGAALTDAAQQQGFDPAFIALVTFPQVLQMMAENINDYAAIGEAFSANQDEVTASIQRLRAQAYASGALRSNPQQQVAVEQYNGQPVYAIQPANPQVVYIPQYDPTLVYAGPGPGFAVGASLLTFGVGIGIGALLIGNRPWGWGGWGWNWGARRAYYNHAPWGGWHGGYRSPRPYFRPRPVIYRNRPGFGGNWHYRPPNYRPPSGARPGYNRPGNNRPGYNRPGNNRPGNPGYNRPGYNRPGTPGHNRPTNGNRPSIQPARPGAPANRPQQRPNRPANRPQARPEQRPAQPRPQQRPEQQRPQQRPQQQNRPAGNRPEGRQRPQGQDRQNR